MRLLFVSLSCAVLVACASAPPSAPAPPAGGWFADHLFAAPTETINDDIFRPSAAMRTFVDTAIAPAASSRGPRRALLDALSHGAQLKLTYDTRFTRNAAEAFDARVGNCLALVIMTAAFAEMLEIPVTFNSVVVDETWSRSDNVYYASGHVNLTLARGNALRTGSIYDAAQELTVDFLPPSDVTKLRSRAISRDTVLAMYLNNRAAEALAAQRLDDAYWWARRAIERVPQALTPYNTLAVIFQRRGMPVRAEALFRFALAQEPANTKVLFNLAQLLEQTGRAAEAAPLRTRLASLEKQPPFEQFDLGIAALKRGDYRVAREHLQRELQRAADYHEVHSALAVVAFHLGDYQEARRHMSQAIALSGTDRERAMYTAKAELLRKLVQQPPTQRQ
jgi:Tfp pilus assembly protein PilF